MYNKFDVMKKDYNFLKKISKQVRYETIKLVHLTKTAHLGSSLSCIDIHLYVLTSINVQLYPSYNYLVGWC